VGISSGAVGRRRSSGVVRGVRMWVARGDRGVQHGAIIPCALGPGRLASRVGQSGIVAEMKLGLQEDLRRPTLRRLRARMNCNRPSVRRESRRLRISEATYAFHVV
jgi:hypothetical protein